MQLQRMQLQVVAEVVADFTALFKLHLPIDVVLDWPIPSSRFLLRHSTGRVSQPKAHIHSQRGSGTAERSSEPRCACYAGARSAASVLYERCRASDGPDLRIRRGSSICHSGSLTQARSGTALQMDSEWNRWLRRQRLHAHAPEVAPARYWARFPSHWCHGIVRHLEGCAVPHRSIRE